MPHTGKQPPRLPHALLGMLLKGEDLAEFSGDMDEIYRQLSENGTV